MKVKGDSFCPSRLFLVKHLSFKTNLFPQKVVAQSGFYCNALLVKIMSKGRQLILAQKVEEIAYIGTEAR